MTGILVPGKYRVSSVQYMWYRPRPIEFSTLSKEVQAFIEVTGLIHGIVGHPILTTLQEPKTPEEFERFIRSVYVTPKSGTYS